VSGKGRAKTKIKGHPVIFGGNQRNCKHLMGGVGGAATARGKSQRREQGGGLSGLPKRVHQICTNSLGIWKGEKGQGKEERA